MSILISSASGISVHTSQCHMGLHRWAGPEQHCTQQHRQHPNAGSKISTAKSNMATAGRLFAFCKHVKVWLERTWEASVHGTQTVLLGFVSDWKYNQDTAIRSRSRTKTRSRNGNNQDGRSGLIWPHNSTPTRHTPGRSSSRCSRGAVPKFPRFSHVTATLYPRCINVSPFWMLQMEVRIRTSQYLTVSILYARVRALAEKFYV